MEVDCSGADGRGRGSRGGMASEEKKKSREIFLMEGGDGCGRKKMNGFFTWVPFIDSGYGSIHCNLLTPFQIINGFDG